MSVGLSVRAYARHRGITHPAVLKAIAAGRIARLPDGTVDPADADARWPLATDPSKPKGTVEPAIETRAADGGSTFLAARTLRESFRARRERLLFRRLEGTMIDAEEVRRAGFAAGRRVRDALLELRERIAGRIAPLSAEERAAIDDEVDKALTELGADQGDAGGDAAADA